MAARSIVVARMMCVVFKSLEEVRGEFDDFQESSRELEAELEAQLEQAESANKDLLSRVQRLEEENESIKVGSMILIQE